MFAPAIPAAPEAPPIGSRIPTALIGRWLIRGGAAAALVAVAIVGGQYVWNALPALPARTAAVEPAKAGPPVPQKATAGLRIATTPPGAQVVVDGKARGVTPLSLTDLSPGRHEVEMTGDAGTVRRTVMIAANDTASIDEGIFSGWVTVYAPFDVTIDEHGAVLRADERHQIMLPAGTHDLRLTNRALGYDAVKQVEVKPGGSTVLQVTPEPSPLTVTASEPAEVWVDGARIGDTPLNAAPLSLGTHDVVVKRTAGGERRFTITIGAKPYTLNVEF
jgi:hypothetical protein